MPIPSHPRSTSRGLPPFEPALSELCALSTDQLREILHTWLIRQRSVPALDWTLLSRQGSHATFTLSLSLSGLTLPVHCRIHQRRTRLQLHHVEAFAGHLLRTPAVGGILITTGEITPEASRAAGAYRHPRLVIYSGPEWLAELAASRAGVKRRRLWAWILDLAHGAATARDCDPRPQEGP